MRRLIQRFPSAISNTLLMLRHLRRAFFEDGLLTVTDSSFKDEPRFRRAYGAAKATGSFGNWDVRWRIHVHCWAATLAARLDGDFVECGVYYGGTAAAVIDYLDFAATGKRYWLLDTFAGLDRSQLTDAERELEAGYFDYDECHDAVCRTFAARPYVKIVRGVVPDTLPAVDAERIAYLHIDMNASRPEIAALTHFWPRIPPFGVVILDDYGWPRHREQRHAFDRFALEHGIRILQLPTGQGVIIKS